MILCEPLSFDGTKCSAFTDVERGRIYLNVDSALDEHYMTWTVHHEAFHRIDYHGDRQLVPDPGWESLNPPWFRYSRDADRFQAGSGRRIDGLPQSTLGIEPRGGQGRKVTRVREMIDATGPYSRLLTGR